MADKQRQIAIIAALPREVAGLVRGVKADAALVSRGIHLYRLPGAVVVAAGMGAGRAALAVEAALAALPDAGLLISAGLAGGCAAGVAAGSVLEVQTVVDARTGERFEGGLASGGVTLVTTDAIASVKEKARLQAAYGAALVDMEAATVARLVRAYGLGFRAIKGVSDAHDFELESLGRFAGKHGSFRTGAFALHTALRPRSWLKAVHLGRGSNAALAGLEQALGVVVAGALDRG